MSFSSGTPVGGGNGHVEHGGAFVVHQHRIDNKERRVKLAQSGGDDFDGGDAAQKAGFNGRRAVIAENSLQLGGDEIGRHELDGVDGERVLGGNGRDHAHSISFQHGPGAQIGLQAGRAAAV